MPDLPISYVGSLPNGGGGEGADGPDWGAIKKLQDSYVTQGSALGFDPNMLKSMGANQLMGFVEGVKLKAMLQHAAAQQAITAEHLRRSLADEQTGAALEGFGKKYGELTAGSEQPQEGDFANEAPPVATPGMDPKRAMAMALTENPRAARSPQLDNLIGALQRGRDYLPLGQTVDVPGIGKLIGTGTGQPHFAATANPEDITVWEDPTTGTRLARSGKSVVKLGTNPDVKPTAAKWPWLLEEDPKKFLQGLQTVDPKERDRALATRIQVNHAMGKTDTMQQLMEEFVRKDAQAPEGPTWWTWIQKKVGLGGGTAKATDASGNGLPAKGAGAQPPTPSGRVKVKAPNGKIGTVPREQLEEAKKNGYVEAE